jgi:ABC-type transport system involved in resistance to organic solvents, ATPase component
LAHLDPRTHDVPESFAIADYVYFLANGGVHAEGTPAELRASTDPTVRQFIDGAPDGPVQIPLSQQDAARGGLRHRRRSVMISALVAR